MDNTRRLEAMDNTRRLEGMEAEHRLCEAAGSPVASRTKAKHLPGENFTP